MWIGKERNKDLLRQDRLYMSMKGTQMECELVGSKDKWRVLGAWGPEQWGKDVKKHVQVGK